MNTGVSHFDVLVTVAGKTTISHCPITQPPLLKRRRAKVELNRGPSVYQPKHYRYAKPNGTHVWGSCWGSCWWSNSRDAWCPAEPGHCWTWWTGTTTRPGHKKQKTLVTLDAWTLSLGWIWWTGTTTHPGHKKQHTSVTVDAWTLCLG